MSIGFGNIFLKIKSFFLQLKIPPSLRGACDEAIQSIFIFYFIFFIDINAISSKFGRLFGVILIVSLTRSIIPFDAK